MAEDILRRVMLDDAPLIHHGNAGGQLQCFINIVGHENSGFTDLLLDPQHFQLEVFPRYRIQCTKRFVHQQNVGVRRQCPRNTDPLRLAARQLLGVFVGVGAGVEIQQGHQLVDACVDPLPRPVQ